MKKTISLLLCTCMVVSSMSIQANAKEIAPTVTSGSAINMINTTPTAASLKAIVSKVKAKITIPSTLTVFDYNFNSGSNLGLDNWELVWSTKAGDERLTILCDANGNISSYNRSSFDQFRQNKPVYLKKQLQKKAEAFLYKVAPSLKGKIEITSSGSNGIYSGEYQYNYRRIEGKIPMPDNSVSISVNYETGEITSCSINWLYDVTIPSADAILSKAVAAAKIGNSLTMKLSYKSRYVSDKNGDTTIKAFLVYEPDKGYISVDAKTGEVYDTRDEWRDSTSFDGNAKATDSSAESATGGTLTPEEIASIDQLNGIISKDNAILQITGNSSLYLDKNATSITAELYKNRTGTKSADHYEWHIQFSDARPVTDKTDTYRSYANAVVDAKTGKVLSFYASVPNYYDIGESKWNDVVIHFTQEQAGKIFENFLKEQVPAYLANSVLSDTNHDYIVAYKGETPVYGGYNYNYDRANEGIVYSDNGMSGAVDGVTGKVYRFNTIWNDTVTFQSPKGALSKEKAFDAYISKEGFGLIYEINQIHSKNDMTIMETSMIADSISYEVRLVYRADIYPTYISPFTGKQLNYDGTLYKKPVTYAYTDVSGSKYEKYILLLADMGIGLEGSEYHPDKAITKAEFLSLLGKLSYDTQTIATTRDNLTMTHLSAVTLLIDLAGLKQIAGIQGIYKTGFADEASIPKEMLGYVALAKGLGILDGKTFGPDAEVSRGEAAKLLVNYLNADIR